MLAQQALYFDPLGDQAVMIHAADETSALAIAAAVRRADWPWVEDVVQAYTTVAVFYPGAQIDYHIAKEQLGQLPWNELGPESAGKLHVIPCCYQLGQDFERISRYTGLTQDQIISRHSETTYTVYAIGFCPGFPYLGYLPNELSGVPRLESPRLKVEAGSIGLTGRQTGIYTEARPGGWNIVGRTPLELVNVADGFFPIRTGDRVRFQPIDDESYRQLRGERLQRF